MKESIRNTKSRDKLSDILEKIMEMHRLKKKYLFCLVYIKWLILVPKYLLGAAFTQ